MYKLILPKRYLLRRKITYLAILAVALCVFIVVVVMTVMNGLVEGFRDKNHDFVGDCIISTDSLVGFPYYQELLSRLETEQYILAISPVAHSYGLLSRPGSDQNLGIEIMGVDPIRHSQVTGFGDFLHYHKNDPVAAFTPRYATDRMGCVVGIDKMWWQRDRAGVYTHSPTPPQMELILSTFPLTAKGALARADLDAVLTESFLYSDDSHSGLVKVDGNMIYIPLEKAQVLFGMDGDTPRISAIHIRFTSGTNLTAGTNKVRDVWGAFVTDHQNRTYADLLDHVRVESWIVNRRGAIAPMEKEQTMLIFLFLMLGVITVFIIFVVFYMIISYKSKDIGILKSVGASSADVVEIFLRFAAFVGLLGAVLGAGIGCAFLVRINDLEGWLFTNFNWQLWDRSVYAIGEIPNTIEWEVIGLIIAFAVLACQIGAVIPTIQAARRRPVEILRVNQV
ncbi:MAG: FtsX-like permease family protein [Sedimentisphaerales bacterium]|nr:FtsX-like permease family protein [Sedimentisphaerales bacterium]